MGYTVTVPPSPATSGTTLSVQTGQGALFPFTPFRAKIWPPTPANNVRRYVPNYRNAEIVNVTDITGDTFTIERKADGSTAQSVAAGWQIVNGILWKYIHLCTPADIQKAIGDLSKWISGGDATEIAKDVCEDAKDELGPIIWDNLSSIFRTSVGVFGGAYPGLTYDWWYAFSGYTLDQLDNVLDTILNPSVLNRAAVAYSVRAIIERKQLSMGSEFNIDPQIYDDLWKRWDKKYNERLDLAMSALQIDLNADGQITEWERTKTHLGHILPA